jgi:YVTN family beta-propeller protein
MSMEKEQMKCFAGRNKLAFVILLQVLLLLTLFSSCIILDKAVMAQSQKSANNTYSLQQSSNNSLLVQQQLKQRFPTYKSPSLGITIGYPPEWGLPSEYSRSVIFYAPSVNSSDIDPITQNSKQNLQITVQSTLDQTLDNYTNNNIDSYRQNKDFKLLNKSTTNLGDFQARKAVFTYNDGKEDFKVMAIYVIEGYNSYALEYTAKPNRYDSYLPIIQKMIDSFQKELLTYENPSLGITIGYPPEWGLPSEDSKSVTFSAPVLNTSDTFQENLRITVQPYTNRALDDFVNNDTNSYRNGYKDFKLLNKSTNTNSSLVKSNLGETIYQTSDVVYKYRDQKGQEYIIHKIFAINDDKIYTLTYSAKASEYTNYLSSVNEMINSFKLIHFFPINKVHFIKYQNDTNGISMQYPSDWREKANMTNKQIEFQSPTNMNVSIGIIQTSIKDLKDQIAGDVDNNKASGYTLIQSHSTTIAGNPATALTYGYTNNTGGYNQEIDIYIDTLKSNRKYEISYIEEPGSHLSSYLQIIQKMIDSLRVQSSNSQLIEPGIGEVGLSPYGIAFNPNTNKLYVASSGSDTVSVIDVTTSKVVQNITMDSSPYGISADPSSNKIYVTVGKDKVVVIDGTTNKIILPISESEGDKTIAYTPVDLAIDSMSKYVFVANKYNNSVSVLSGDSNDKVEDIDVGLYRISDTALAVQALAVNPTTHKLYVANGNSPTGTVSVVDYYTDSDNIFNYHITDIRVGDTPQGVAINPRTNTVYISNTRSNSISVIDGTSDKVVKTIDIDYSPFGMAFNPNTNKLYVANTEGGTVSVIDGISNKVVKTVITGGSPTNIAINPKTNMIYVTNTYLNSVSVIDGSNDNLAVSTTFNKNIPEGGNIICIYSGNKKQLSSNDYLLVDLNTPITCNVNVNDGFRFNSWSGILDYAANNNPVKFNASHYGTINAIFERIPSNNLLSISDQLKEGTIVIVAAVIGHGLLIPFLGRTIEQRHKKRQATELRKQVTSINKIYELHCNNTEMCLGLLNNKENEITDLFEEQSLDHLSYEILTRKISEYIEKIKIR